MAKKVGDYEIPFDGSGNQQHYPDYWIVGVWPNARREGPLWKPNEPFEDTLTYVGYARGRSAAYFRFLRSNGKQVTVFLKELEEMIPHMVGGKISGTFQFVKRGQNYGCTLKVS